MKICPLLVTIFCNHFVKAMLSLIRVNFELRFGIVFCLCIQFNRFLSKRFSKQFFYSFDAIIHWFVSQLVLNQILGKWQQIQKIFTQMKSIVIRSSKSCKHFTNECIDSKKKSTKLKVFTISLIFIKIIE